MGPARFWIGPAKTVTPLHCDYDDNIFAQIWGRKRIFLAPPHHDEFLYPREANALLFGSPFDPEAPDYDRFPLARQASLIECIVEPGDMLYVPAGWYHQVRAQTFSLSANRWARGVPFALQGNPALFPP
jgi:ribosomal protein L16 Arg81 hydroxylase